MSTTASPRVILALIVTTCVLMSILGIGTFAFVDPESSGSQFLKLIWIGPMLAMPVLGLIAISRKLLVGAAIALFLANYLGSLVLMGLECASGNCIATRNSMLSIAQVAFSALCTHQTGLSIILVVLAFLHRRTTRIQEEVH